MKKFNLDKFYTNSKFDFYKNFWKFVIAPVVLVIAAIVLVCTVGFNAGFDFTGGTQISIFSNNDETFVGENIKSYNLEKGEEYNAFVEKINTVLRAEKVSSLSYQKTIVTVEELGIYDGHAVVLKIQNLGKDEVASLTEALAKTLGYDNATNVANAEEGVIANTVSPIISQYTLNLVITALISALAIIFVYLVFRLGIASAMSVVCGVAIDTLIMLCFALVCRLQVELSFLAGVVVLMMFSVINNIFLFNSINNNATNGKFEDNGKYSRASNKDVANYSIKESLSRQSIFACVSLVAVCLLTIVATSGVRAAMFPFFLGVLASIYTSIFILPVLWAISYVPSKKKKVREEKKEDEYVV